MDLVLANPLTKMPIGHLPDFLYEIRTDGMYVERMGELYHGLHDFVGPRGVKFTPLPLDSVNGVRENSRHQA
jgi:hypothetical protein